MPIRALVHKARGSADSTVSEREAQPCLDPPIVPLAASGGQVCYLNGRALTALGAADFPKPEKRIASVVRRK